MNVASDGRPALTRRAAIPALLLALLPLAACGDGGTDPDQGDPPDEAEQPIPAPGPHFSVSPIPVDDVARITPIGYNNKVFPNPHTYWETCESWAQLPTGRACHLERQPLRAPGGGVVRDVDPQADGTVVVEGPPGLIWHFGHVTPAEGLSRGTAVQAGDVVATMFYEHGFDFGVLNYGVKHPFVDSTRYHHGYLYQEHPIAQFPVAMRPPMLDRIQSLSEPRLGRLSFDVAGTASGGWFIEGAPEGDAPLRFDNEHMLLWLARWVERQETRILSVGDPWPGMPNRLLVVDAAAPDWEDITPASGVVSMKLWNIGEDARANPTWPGGTALVQVLDGDRLQIEWFDTHEPGDSFTAAARIYER